MSNIFDLENLDDLPEKIKNSIVSKPRRGLGQDSLMILSLFDECEQLSAKQIYVGLYRKYNVDKRMIDISSTISYLKNRKYIKKVDDSNRLYEKVKKNEEFS